MNNREAIRDLTDPAERLRYMRRRLEKRESTPGVSWDEGDHADMRWALDIAEAAITVINQHPASIVRSTPVWRFECAYCHYSTSLTELPVKHYKGCHWEALWKTVKEAR